MSFTSHQVTFKEAGFSSLITDYVSANPALADYFAFPPDKNSLTKAIKSRKNYPVNREVLVSTLLKQYEATVFNSDWKSSSVFQSIQQLGKSETFTVTTGHQLNIFTGPLYFVFKILTAVRQAEELKKMFPENHFVPVYWMATEDHDLEEIKSVNVAGEKITWQTNQKGATGRMNTQGFKETLGLILKKFSASKNEVFIRSILETAYLKNNTLANATRSMVHELFSEYGIVVLDADEPVLKRQAISVFKDDLQCHTAFKEFNNLETFEKKYGLQVHAREINLFYLQPDTRERISKNGDGSYEVVSTDIRFSPEELFRELEKSPERFSPNVILRPVYQEMILPNLCYTGGPAEVHYWLQLKKIFEHNKVFFPIIALRNCMMVADSINSKTLTSLKLNWKDIFDDVNVIANKYFREKYSDKLDLGEAYQQLELAYKHIKEKASAIDVTLAKHADAEQVRLKKRLAATEKRMLRALKKKNETDVQTIQQLKDSLFPGGNLQERTENVFPFIAEYGKVFFDDLLKVMDLFTQNFQVLSFDSK